MSETEPPPVDPGYASVTFTGTYGVPEDGGPSNYRRVELVNTGSKPGEALGSALVIGWGMMMLAALMAIANELGNITEALQ